MNKLSVWDILKTPHITEKAMLLKDETSEEGKSQVLTFRINRDASKDDVRSAVEEILKVKVARVRTQNYQGKMKRRGRHEGRRPSWKKAIVTLQAGENPVEYDDSI